LRRAFEARCWARARLWWEHVYTIHEAVDVLQRDAEASGLVDEIGQDEVQRILGEAFAEMRPELDVAEVVPDALPDDDSSEQHGVPKSTLDAAAWLVFQAGNPQRFEAWLLKHSAAERAAIIAHIDKRRGGS
jgi:hypothetical protein